jgi:hypothetical protein
MGQVSPWIVPNATALKAGHLRKMQRFHMIAPNLHLLANTVISNADPATPHWNLKRRKKVVMPVIPMYTSKR